MSTLGEIDPDPLALATGMPAERAAASARKAK
jgi:hypothetical protein